MRGAVLLEHGHDDMAGCLQQAQFTHLKRREIWIGNEMTSDIGLYSTKLCKKNAARMARLSSEVYKSKANKEPDDGAILASLKSTGERVVSVAGTSKNSAQAILVEHEDYFCMAFRGTDQWEDWIDNLDGRKAHSEQAMFGDFHRGFYRSCNDVWDFLDDRYRALRAEDHKQRRYRPLFLTGHSLGGAMATVAAAKLILEDRPFSGVYTYGQPRAVKRSTAQFLSNECGARYFRFQNNEDLVTRVPSRLMGYSHVGRCLYIDADGQIQTDPGFWYRFLDVVDGALDTVKNRLKDEKSAGLIGDHDIDRYIEHISKWNIVE